MFDFQWLFEGGPYVSHPIGKIKNYFYQMESQQRGSLHVHCLLWIENALQIDKNTDDEVIQFIYQYVTCEYSRYNNPII